MKIVNRRQLRKKIKSEKNVNDRLTELEKMVRRLRYNALMDIEHVEDLKKNGTFISNPNELCHMILEGIGELHDRFNNIANKYTKLVGKISKQ